MINLDEYLLNNADKQSSKIINIDYEGVSW